jgi:hypothetical protein
VDLAGQPTEGQTMDEELFIPGAAHAESHLEFASLKVGKEPHCPGHACYRFEVRKTNEGFLIEKVHYHRLHGSHNWHETGRRIETVLDRKVDAIDYSQMEQGHHQW